MPQTKGITRTVAKWKDRVAVAGNEYKMGIASPKTPWSQGASQGAQAWADGVNAAVGRGAFAAGVSKAGDAKWKAASDQLGSARYSQGVAFGTPYFQSGIGNVLSTIESVSLGPKGAAGSAGNYQRVQQIGDALHAARLANKG